MKNQVLSIEQMQELKELGIDTSKASVYWIKTSTDGGMPYEILSLDYTLEYNPNVFPTFTLQDIVNLLDKPHDLMVYYCSTMVWAEKMDSEEHIHEEYIEDSVLINAFNMLKWCKQNNYI